MKRVVITGIGALTPLGNTFEESWQGLIDGRSGIDMYPEILETPICLGRLKDYDPLRYMSAKETHRLDRFVQYALASALMASEDASLSDIDKQTAVIIGSSRGGIMSIDKACRDNTLRASPYLMPATTISMAASYIAQNFGLNGHCLGISNACSSGANAVGEGYRLIAHGYAARAICGGTDAPICPICILGYRSGKMMSMKSSRPFDRDRDGFILSEGACVIILEDLEKAITRGARIYAEIIGYTNTADGFDMVKPNPDTQAFTMRAALIQSGLSIKDIDLISAHAAGTKTGDQSEASAINAVFGVLDPMAAVTANKAATGHMLAASGTFEIAALSASINHSIIPPTINLKNIDLNCLIHVILNKINTPINTALSNSFGFGGLNCVIVIKKLEL